MVSWACSSGTPPAASLPHEGALCPTHLFVATPRDRELLLTGHSLGGGVASFAAKLLRAKLPRRMSVSAIVFAPPAILPLSECSAAYDKLVDGYICGADVVPRLSIGSLRHLLEAATIAVGAANRTSYTKHDMALETGQKRQRGVFHQVETLEVSSARRCNATIFNDSGARMLRTGSSNASAASAATNPAASAASYATNAATTAATAATAAATAALTSLLSKRDKTQQRRLDRRRAAAVAAHRRRRISRPLPATAFPPGRLLVLTRVAPLAGARRCMTRHGSGTRVIPLPMKASTGAEERAGSGASGSNGGTRRDGLYSGRHRSTRSTGTAASVSAEPVQPEVSGDGPEEHTTASPHIGTNTVAPEADALAGGWRLERYDRRRLAVLDVRPSMLRDHGFDRYDTALRAVSAAKMRASKRR